MADDDLRCQRRVHTQVSWMGGEGADEGLKRIHFGNTSHPNQTFVVVYAVRVKENNKNQ